MVHPNFNIPVTEMFFSEAPVDTHIGVGKITKKRVRDMIMHTVVNNITGPKTYLIKDRATYIVTTSKIDGANLIPRNTTSLANQLQQVIHDVGK